MIVEESKPKSVIIHMDRFSLSKDLQLEAIEEFKELCLSSGTKVCAEVSGKIDRPSPNFFVKQGKLEEIKQYVDSNKANLVIFNNDLSPSQERNLEKYLCARVLDRTSLILDIFATRASSHVGKLQVELAQLTHLSTRLVRGWSHLERQKGGIGLRGPGETQLETDRRLIGHRIKNLKKKLNKAHNQISDTTKNLLQNGIKIERSNKYEKFFVRGLPNLIKNELETDLDSLNQLLSEIETGKMATKMIKALKKSKGVQIFIGSNTNLFKNANLSMIFSNYKTKNGLTGAIGVIGPKRIDYQRIVPIVGYLSEIISNKK